MSPVVVTRNGGGEAVLGDAKLTGVELTVGAPVIGTSEAIIGSHADSLCHAGTFVGYVSK